GRRIGKTSLLEALLRALKAYTIDPNSSLLPISVFLDCAGESLNSVEGFFQTIRIQAEAVLADLWPLLLADVPIAQKREPAVPIFRRMLEHWGRTVMTQKGNRLRLILLLDECEQLVEKPWASELYAVLRSILVGQRTRALFKVVMAGSYRFLTQVREYGSPLR